MFDIYFILNPFKSKNTLYMRGSRARKVSGVQTLRSVNKKGTCVYQNVNAPGIRMNNYDINHIIQKV